MDFPYDYMRMLLAKEIDVAAELQKQKSQVVYQQYCAGGTMHRGYYCPSLTEDLWLGNTKRGRLCKKRPPEERLSHIYGDPSGHVFMLITAAIGAVVGGVIGGITALQRL